MEKKKSYLPMTTPTNPSPGPSTGHGHGQGHSSPPPSPPMEQSPSKSMKRLLQQSQNRVSSPFWNLMRNVFFVVAAIINLGLSIWVVIEHGNLPELFPGGDDPSRRIMDSGQCHLPQLVAHSPEMRLLMSEPNRIDCAYVANSDFPGRIFFKVDEAQRVIRREGISIPCCYRPFYRVNDNEVWIEPNRERRYVCHNLTEPVTEIPEKIEFIEILCDDGRKSYKDGFPFFRRKPEVEARVASILAKDKEADPYGPPAERLGLIVLGLDSTSQQNFIRRMPKSLEFLTKELNAVRLDGYVKVGENTLPNLVPLLTGLSLDEFKEDCIVKDPSSAAAVHLDGCPFVWKHFKEKGYRTVFAEDEVNTGIFNLYWSHAFLHPPTDHYLRPYSLRMVNTQNMYDGFCMGPRMSLQVLLDYLEKSARTYSSPSEPMFHLNWASKLSHDDFNRLSWGDVHLHKTLRTLASLGTLNHTALFLLSDHGARSQELRKSRQGQLEDRLPLAYVVLPPWFASKYPQAVANLRNNAKLITGAYDLHETFLDLADLAKLNDRHTHYIRQRKLKVAEKKGHRRGTSLFSPLPPSRSCTSAGIPPAWCICYKKKKISIKSMDVHDALAFVLRQLNTQLRPYPGTCGSLRLSKVISALKWHPDEAIEDTYSGNSAEESWKKASLLQINFLAGVGGGHGVGKVSPEFEVTVLFDPDHGWRFTEQVVRLDKYEEGAWCMEKQELKHICVCLDREERPEMDDFGGHDAIF